MFLKISSDTIGFRTHDKTDAQWETGEFERKNGWTAERGAKYGGASCPATTDEGLQRSWNIMRVYGNFNMARVGLYWILGKEKCTEHLNHGLCVRVGGERRDVLGKENT
jgi:hypothetical protein